MRKTVYSHLTMGIIILTLCITMNGGCRPEYTAKKWNILLILVDDLNDMVGALDGEYKVTPNLDRLAGQGTRFTRAYCSAPACGPTRASLLSGRLPSSTGIYYNSQVNAAGTLALVDVETLPEYFKKQGYLTGIYGKVFHERNNHYHAWLCTPGYFSPHNGFWANIPDTSMITLTDFRYEGGSNFTWGSLPDDWENQGRKGIDAENTDRVIQVLREHHDQPFFLSLGLIRPHLPWIVPAAFFDRIPLEPTAVPAGFRENDLDDLPACARWMAREVPGHHLGDSHLHRVITEKGQWAQAVRAYQASVAYMDHQVGCILDALEKSSHADNTIVLLFSDHGYHLGEKEHWTKFGLWEKSNRVPLIIRLPRGHQQICDQPVSLLDIYPTLVSLTGLPPPGHPLEGIDLTPLLNNPETPRGRPVLSTYGYQCHSLRDDTYRYIRYRNGKEELYDHRQDPYEWNNLANDPGYRGIKEYMKKHLPALNEPESGQDPGLGWIPEVFEENYVYP